MIKKITLLGLSLLISIYAFQSCTNKVAYPYTATQYPNEVAQIIITNCATDGCHNQQSYRNAGGLLLDSWEALMNGTNNGACVVPFSPENSSLLYYINTDSAEGIVAKPTMPINQTPLTKAQYKVLRDWIANGAPNIDGIVPFSEQATTRQKTVVTLQGCDKLGIIDGNQVIARYIPLGITPQIESPHAVRVSKDGAYAYISFLAGTVIQKVDLTSNQVLETIDIGTGSWNILHVSEDGNKLLVCDWQSNGKLVLLQTKPLQVLKEFGGGATGLFKFPHGIIANTSFDTFRVTAQYGNYIYKFTADENLYTKISLDGKPLSNNPGTLDPHELYYTPDKSKYFITCEASNEVRIFDAKKDTLIKTISLGIFPQEIAMSKTKPYAFITCSEDVSSFPGFKGSVYVINYNTLTITKRIDAPFYQPHGINVDDLHAIFYVYSRNVNPSGPAPHHSSSCAGRNGYYQVFDLNTLNLKTNKRFETIVDPYSADTRFK